jgi:hypothetical protein
MAGPRIAKRRPLARPEQPFATSPGLGVQLLGILGSSQACRLLLAPAPYAKFGYVAI